MDAALSAAREAVLEDLAGGAPDPRYIDLFKLKYDYHNVRPRRRRFEQSLDIVIIIFQLE